MGRWHHSGTRRDVCALLYEEGELTGQELKTRLGRHYERRLDPRRFRGTLSELVEAGHLERRTEGLLEAYALTEAGERGVRDHFEWLRARVES